MMKFIILFLITSLSYGQGLTNLQAQRLAISGCTADPNQMAIDSNASSDPNCNESENTTKYIGSNRTVTADTDSNVGTWSILVETVATGSVAFAGYRFNATASDTYDVTFDAKSTQGTSVRISAWTNSTGGPSGVTVTSSWASYGPYSITATSTGFLDIRFYSGASTATVTGDNIYIDNLSVIHTNP